MEKVRPEIEIEWLISQSFRTLFTFEAQIELDIR